MPLQPPQSTWNCEHPKTGAAASSRQTGHSRLAAFLSMESTRNLMCRPEGEGEGPLT